MWSLVLPRWKINRVVRKALSERDKATDVSRLIDRMWELHKDVSKNTPKSQSRGVSFMLYLAAKDLALYKALRETSIQDEEAKQHVEDINWDLSKSLGAPMYRLSRIRSRNREVRLKWVNDLLYRFLFTKPFKRIHVASDANDAFDVTSCPIADYFKSQGESALCHHAFCNADHRLAAAWHSRLERKGTIAEGSDCCDFRFYVDK